MSKTVKYRVPEGYFEDLQTRLMQIPSAEGFRRTSHSGRRVRYLAIAASVAAGVLIGATLAQRQDAAGADESEIVEYLIESGTTLAQIVYSMEQ